MLESIFIATTINSSDIEECSSRRDLIYFRFQAKAAFCIKYT
jgi:hypothetical protein